jgi:trehalose/maltose hydrolase-like predicted phosphorylase
MADCWSIAETAFEARTARAYEGLFTLGSGYLHVRGSLEEHLADAPQNVSYTRLPANVTSEKFPDTKSKWGTYVPGVFGRHPLLNNQMLNLPCFIGLAPAVGGEKLDVEQGRIADYRRELRLDTAVLRRSLTWRTRLGPVLAVDFERFISAARPGLCVQRLTIRADRATELTVAGGIDADVRTNGYDHFTAVNVERAGASDVAGRVVTDAGDEVRLRARLLAAGAAWAFEQDPRAGRLTATLRIPAGGSAVVEKRTAVATSRDRAAADPARQLDAVAGRGYDALLAEHAAVWAGRWQRSDVVIEGDPDAQLALRVSLYHLMRAHVPNDCRVAIDAKGYAGEAYWGRFFWDTEMYLLPFFLYTDPSSARTLTDFRVHSLPGARDNAARYGYPGARYATESDGDGHECCPNWQYCDHEIHVTADAVYGLAHYAQAAGDSGYLKGPAAAVIVETARYWLKRVDWRTGDGYPSLLGVMGPDEYTLVSSNNSYTNRMAAFALALAAEVGPHAGATPEECREFARVARGLPIPRAAGGRLVLQCEEFPRFAEPNFAELWRNRAATFAAQVSQERLYRSKCLKQADVLMLMMLFPHEFTDAEVRAAWDHYVPYTTHDSSLSAGAHAIVACRLGLLDEALAFWRRSCAQDLDFAHGGAAEGIHIAGAGANWQMAVFGFAGMATAPQAQALTLRPRLPAGWTRLAFPVVWRGTPVYVDITPAGCVIANRGSRALDAVVNGAPLTVPAGGRVTAPPVA